MRTLIALPLVLATLQSCITISPSPSPDGRGDHGSVLDTSKERIGRLRLGLNEDRIRSAIVGMPVKGRTVYLAGTDETVQEWTYASQGISLGMHLDLDGALSVGSISISAPCLLTSAKGIGIGSTEAEMLSAYEHTADPQDGGWTSLPGRVFAAGSIFDGLLFTIRDGRVSEMFLGAAAE